MRGYGNLLKKFFLFLSGIAGVSWGIFHIFFLLSERTRNLLIKNGTNMFGHQLGWQAGGLFLRKIYQKTKTEWPLYGVLYFILPLWAVIVAKNPALQALGLGRSVAGFASIGVWILMERLLEVRAKPKQWSRYFSFYIVFYHLSGLLTQATFGTSLFAYRHAWASMVAFLLLTTVLPSLLLWSEGAEVERVSLFRQFFKHIPSAYFPWGRYLKNFYKKIFYLNPRLPTQARVFGVPRWRLWGRKMVNWKHFNALVIGLAGVVLGCLSAAYPIYFRIHRTACAFPMPFSLGLVWLILGNAIAFFTRSFLLRISVLWRLKLDLLAIGLTIFAFLKIRAAYAFSINLTFLGYACYMLYPDLLARMQQWSAMKPLPEVRQKMENCLQYANYAFVMVSLVDRTVSSILLKSSERSIDDFLYYFLNGYLFLFCFALIPDEADHLVKEGKSRMRGWIKSKQKTVAKKVLDEIKTIKRSEK